MNIEPPAQKSLNITPQHVDTESLVEVGTRQLQEESGSTDGHIQEENPTPQTSNDQSSEPLSNQEESGSTDGHIQEENPTPQTSNDQSNLNLAKKIKSFRSGALVSEGIVKPLVLKVMGFHTQKVVERRVLFDLGDEREENSQQRRQVGAVAAAASPGDQGVTFPRSSTSSVCPASSSKNRAANSGISVGESEQRPSAMGGLGGDAPGVGCSDGSWFTRKVSPPLVFVLECVVCGSGGWAVWSSGRLRRCTPLHYEVKVAVAAWDELLCSQ
nr:hypothetical protein Iba_chr07bCG8440 [Ipomoea batatas]